MKKPLTFFQSIKRKFAQWKANRTNATIRRLKAENAKLVEKLAAEKAAFKRVSDTLKNEEHVSYMHARQWMAARHAIKEVMEEDVWRFEHRTTGKNKRQ